MNQHSIFTNKKLYIDKNVWVVMIITILLCLVLLGYRKIENDSCSPFTISSHSLLTDRDGKYETGQTIIFSTTLPGGKEATWYFGDKTMRQRSASASMRHKFNEQGVYTVRAITNGNCSSELIVNIKKSENLVIQGADRNIHPIKIYGNGFPAIGKPEKYLSDVLGNTYEWKIINKSSFPTINQQAANYTFTKPGLYVLQLTIDHDRNKRSQIEINVSEDLAKALSKRNETPDLAFPPIPIPKKVIKPQEQPTPPQEQPNVSKEQSNITKEQPTTQVQSTSPKEQPTVPNVQSNIAPAAPKRKVTYIHPAIFQTYLDAVITGEKGIADFDEYLIDKGNTKVRENGKLFKTFSQFCQEIKGKRVTIKSVDLKRDPYDKTIVKQIDVEAKWGIFQKH